MDIHDRIYRHSQIVKDRLPYLSKAFYISNTEWGESGCGKCGTRYPSLVCSGTLCGKDIFIVLYTMDYMPCICHPVITVPDPMFRVNFGNNVDIFFYITLKENGNIVMGYD